ncbi:MAG: amino acid ABC transporter ATP-binding protein [Spirochaetaceae bacterium]|jgi:ABC-type polar amino acid transport system ATPase subunit|nr:amino acid ABC transporter ATP-binding protein [Spirochaetaceae bacterium]
MIAIHGLNISFGENRVLKNIDLDVEPGTVVVIIGPSGAGKSTLLRCINLLETPESGTICIGEQTLDYKTHTKHEVYSLRRKTSMVFQGYNLFLHKTALANVEEGLITVKGMSKKEARDMAVFHLEKVGLADKLSAYPAELSGGQQQRVAIARAVAMNPQVILFDEPTSALDPELVQEVLLSMRKVASEGNTMIVVTHELAFARDVGSKIVFLAEGTILEQESPGCFFTHPRTERARVFMQQFSGDYGYQI